MVHWELDDIDRHLKRNVSCFYILYTEKIYNEKSHPIIFMY